MRLKYFVLKPSGDTVHAKAARSAMRLFASEIEMDDPKMSSEIKQWAYEEDRASHLRSFNDLPTKD